ncbi:Chaperone protein DnaK, partial [hydrothermal vent metagenome]
MNSDTKYLGIDLGTTNSAVAIFVDGEVKTLLNTRGEVNTPSVVRVTPNAIVVGSKAKKHLHSDFANTFKEFKRLMGTESLSKADRNGHCWSAQALSAELLKSLRTLADEQAQCNFDKVVITVPALFELPQSKATAEAARMAGFDKVELLPEPVASGLAAGWSNECSDTAWLVYDLGGGTFDASLLESRDGLLRVVGHDGDNFLGGRDIDSTIVSWIKEQLQEKHSLSLLPEHNDYKQAIRHLEDAAETAKIRLSSTTQSVIELEFEYDDEDYEFDLGFSRETLKTLCAPLIQRSIDICKRLLKTQGLDLEHLQRVVLVGGPAHMPLI